MNSFNHNSELSNFLKKDLINSLSLNDYYPDHQNSRSFSFAHFYPYSQPFNVL